MIRFFLKLSIEPAKLANVSDGAIEVLINRLALHEDRDWFLNEFGESYKLDGEDFKEPKSPYGNSRITRVLEIEDWPAWFLDLEQEDRLFIQRGLEIECERQIVLSLAFPFMHLADPERSSRLERSFFAYFVPEILTQEELYVFDNPSTKVITIRSNHA